MTIRTPQGLLGLAGLVLACLGLSTWAAAQSPTLPAASTPPASAPPLSAYARLPQVQGLVLSPDGRRFAAIRHRGDEALVTTGPVDGSAPARALLRSDTREQRIAWLHWVSNTRLVASLHHASRRGSVTTTETRLTAMNFDGSAPLNLVQPTAFASPSSYGQIQDQVVDWLPEDGHHILLQGTVEGRDMHQGVIKVDVDSGARDVVQGPRAFAVRWMSDASHRVRVAVLQRGSETEVQVCDPDGSRWRTMWRYEIFAANAVEPLGFGPDPQRLFVRADHQGRRAVFEVDLSQPEAPLTLQLALPAEDAGGALVRDPLSGRVLGASVTLAGQSGAGLWDPALKAWSRALDEALPGRYNRLLQFSGDGQRVLIHSSGNGIPGRYFLAQRDSGQLTPLAQQYPELAERAGQTLARKQAVQIRARDGLMLPGFLSLPPAAQAQDEAAAAAPAVTAQATTRPRWPAVILPHGGPISRDTLDFDPWSSFLASRGVAVLQVNFRGSSGLGTDFRNAGLKRWGLEMQDDISDAVQWLVQRGVADPQRICIVGGSYGGYAALMGAVKTPELYRCVVSLAGVSDLIELARHQAQYRNGRDVFEQQVGSAWADSRQLQDTSPVRGAARIRAPVLLVHGTEDRSVPYAQSAAMAEALKAAGKTVRFVPQEGGDHFLSVQAHRTQFFQELDDFLTEHLALER